MLFGYGQLMLGLLGGAGGLCLFGIIAHLNKKH
jgi:hypothetical protein